MYMVTFDNPMLSADIERNVFEFRKSEHPGTGQI